MFTLFKLSLATAIHNLKWAKITLFEIKYLQVSFHVITIRQ